MSWYTAGEIVVWLLIAAVLGFVLGWLLRGMLRPSARAADERRERPATGRAGTRVEEVDTGDAQTRTGSVAVPVSRFAPPDDDAAARARLAEIASRTAGEGDLPHDDLVRIHGVGPQIARLLASMGIVSFRQVARLTPGDVAVVGAAIAVFPGRIERDDWISSARELHREVYGSEP